MGYKVTQNNGYRVCVGPVFLPKGRHQLSNDRHSRAKDGFQRTNDHRGKKIS